MLGIRKRERKKRGCSIVKTAVAWVNNTNWNDKPADDERRSNNKAKKLGCAHWNMARHVRRPMSLSEWERDNSQGVTGGLTWRNQPPEAPPVLFIPARNTDTVFCLCNLWIEMPFAAKRIYDVDARKKKKKLTRKKIMVIKVLDITPLNLPWNSVGK